MRIIGDSWWLDEPRAKIGLLGMRARALRVSTRPTKSAPICRYGNYSLYLAAHIPSGVVAMGRGSAPRHFQHENIVLCKKHIEEVLE